MRVISRGVYRSERGQCHAEDFYKEVDSLQVCKLVVVCVNTYAKEETSVATVDDLVIPELRVR